MSDLNNTPKSFRPVLITEDKLKTNDVIDGYLYFATDSRKIYLGDNNEYLSMGGNSGVYYGNREPEEGEEDLESTLFDFIISSQIEGDMIPNINDLILNTPDKSFYRVRQVFADADYLTAEKLAIAGGSSPDGPGGTTTATPTIQGLQLNNQYYSASKPETMKIKFQGRSPSAENNYIDHVEYKLGQTKIVDYNQYQFGEDIIFDFSKYLKDLNTSGGKNNLEVLIEDAFGTRSKLATNTSFLFYILNPSLTADSASILKVSDDAPGLKYTYIPKGGSATGSSSDLERYIEVSVASLENPTNPLYSESKIFTQLGYESTLPIDFSKFSASHGTYVLTAVYRVKVLETGEFIDSNTLYHQVIYLETNNREPILATSFISGTIQQYSKYQMDYMIADGYAQQEANVIFYIENEEDSRIAILNTINQWDYTFTKVGSYNISVEYGGKKWKLGVLTVEEYSSEDIPFIDESIPELYLSVVGKKNTQSNKDVWQWTNPSTKEIYSAKFEKFLWGNENGWIEDPNGEPALKLTNGAQLSIPNYQPFKNDAATYGLTIEVDFMFSKVMDYTKPLIHCLSYNADGSIKTGFNISGQKATLNSNTYKATTDEIKGEEGADGSIDAKDMALQAFTQYFNEDTRIHLTYVIEKPSKDGTYQFVYTYLNGVLSGIMRMGANESFSQNINKPAIFKIDSTFADVYLYSLRTYTQALSPSAVINNYMADINDIDKKINLAKKNDILNDSGIVSKKIIDQLSVSLGIPYVVFEGGIPIHKQFTKKKLIKEGYLDGYPMVDTTDYNLPVTKSDYRLFSMGMYERDGAQTKTIMEIPISLENSSTGETVDKFEDIEEGEKYWFNRGVQVYGQGTSSMVYPVKNLRLKFMNEEDYPTVYKGSCPLEIVCFKADYMDSSASHNTQTANLIYDLYNSLGLKTPPQKFMYKSHDITTAIRGYPIICFYKDYNNDGGKNDNYSDGEYIYIGRYNFNMDKATPEPFGFPGMYHKTGKTTIDDLGRVREEVEVCGLLTEQVNGMTALPLVEKTSENGEIIFEEVYEDITQCWEVLNNDTDSPTKFLTPEGNYGSYRDALEATWVDYYEDRYPDEISGLQKDGELGKEENAKYREALQKGLFRMSAWVNSTATTELPPAGTRLEETVYYLTLDKDKPTKEVQYYDENHNLVSVEEINAVYVSTNTLNLGDTFEPSSVSISLETFENKIEKNKYNIYTFSYDGANWGLIYYDEDLKTTIYESNINLAEYGIGVSGVTPKEGWSIIVDYTYSYSNWRPGSLYEKHEYDNARYRLAKFKNEFTQYFDMDFSLFYYILTLTLLMMDSRAKNMMLASWDTKIWYPIFYDMDTMLGINNTGFNKFGYDIEDDPKDKVFNGYDSVLWNNFKACFYEEIAKFYSKMREYLTLEKLLSKYNDNGANAWVEALHVNDAIYKYERPYEQGYYDGKNGSMIDRGTISYLYAAQGKRSTHRSWWLKNRLGYLDSKYKPEALGNDKPSQSSSFSFRAYALPAQQSSDEAQACINAVPANHKFNITALTNSYQSIFVGNIVYGPVYAKANETVTIGPDTPKHEVESYILNPELIADLGDLSDKYLGSWNMPNNKLTELKFGRSSRSHPDNYNKYYNNLLTSLNIGTTTPYLKYLNIARCNGLIEVDVSKCNKLETIDAEKAANLTSITFPSDSILKTLYLPKTLENIVINNQPYLETIVFDEIPSLGKIHLNNAGTYNSYPLAKKSFENIDNTVVYYFSNVNWVIDDFNDGETVESIDVLDKLISTISFVPEEGYNRATALTGTITLKGNIHVDEYNIYEKYKKEFPNIEFKFEIGESGSLTEAINITFMSLEKGNEDNGIHYQVKASGKADGDDLAKLISKDGPNGYAMEAPKKNSTVESSFEFTGYWIYGGVEKYYDPAFFADKPDTVHPEGAISFEKKTPIVDMTFYPEYRTVPKKYEVVFHDPNGGVIPQDVFSGGNPVNAWEVKYGDFYDGPIKNYYYKDDSGLDEEETYFFKGWGTTKGATSPVFVDPTNLEVKSNLNLYAYIEKVNVYNIPYQSRYKEIYYDYFKISDSTISLRDEYKQVLKGKIILPSQDKNGNYIQSIGDFREGGNGGITHIYFSPDAQYTTVKYAAFCGRTGASPSEGVYYSPRIKTIKLPSTITKFEDYSFAYNNALKDINWSNLTNLTTIETQVFQAASAANNDNSRKCSISIKELPESLEKIGTQAFWGASESVEITKLPKNLSSIGDAAFAFSPNVAITELNGEKPLRIEAQAFFAAGKNIDVSNIFTIGKQVEYIGNQAFTSSTATDYSGFGHKIDTVYLAKPAHEYNENIQEGSNAGEELMNLIGLVNVVSIIQGEETEIEL